MTPPAVRFLSALRPFVPRRGLGNGHVMTVVTWARERKFPNLPEPEARLIRVADDSQVLVHCYWQPDRASLPTLVALHGLEGSSSSHYMRGLADKAFQRGWNAILVNQRNCGGTEHLTPGLYHSGLTEDPRTIIRTLVEQDGVRAVGVAGYSLGGNLTLKIAAELGASAALPIFGAVAVSPTMELDLCVKAIERRANFVYQWNFVRNLKARMRRKVALRPGSFDLAPLDRIHSIRAFDDRYTAPFAGFAGASDYYHRASAMRIVSRITIPTLIVSAANDPFVPAEQFDDPAVRNNPNVAVRVEAAGGHCGFVSEPEAGDDGYWAERTAIGFLNAVMPAGFRVH